MEMGVQVVPSELTSKEGAKQGVHSGNQNTKQAWQRLGHSCEEAIGANIANHGWHASGWNGQPLLFLPPLDSRLRLPCEDMTPGEVASADLTRKELTAQGCLPNTPGSRANTLHACLSLKGDLHSTALCPWDGFQRKTWIVYILMYRGELLVLHIQDFKDLLREEAKQ